MNIWRYVIWLVNTVDNIFVLAWYLKNQCVGVAVLMNFTLEVKSFRLLNLVEDIYVHNL